MKKIIVLLIVLAFLNVSPVSMAGSTYYDDGLSHTLDYSNYSRSDVFLDSNVANNPGTHADLVDGLNLGHLLMYNLSTATISGGEIHSLDAYDNTSVTMLDGIVYNFRAKRNSTITMTGGRVEYSFRARDNSTTIISGGTIGDYIIAYENAYIYLDGTDFKVDGKIVAPGSRLSNLGTLVEHRSGNSILDYYTGTITGTLADGSFLDNTFNVNKIGVFAGTADIVIIPEPATLLLFGVGGLLLRKRRS